jgi:hypothetical protein
MLPYSLLRWTPILRVLAVSLILWIPLVRFLPEVAGWRVNWRFERLYTALREAERRLEAACDPGTLRAEIAAIDRLFLEAQPLCAEASVPPPPRRTERRAPAAPTSAAAAGRELAVVSFVRRLIRGPDMTRGNHDA